MYATREEADAHVERATRLHGAPVYVVETEHGFMLTTDAPTPEIPNDAH
jgi:hypothetical protein